MYPFLCSFLQEWRLNIDLVGEQYGVNAGMKKTVTIIADDEVGIEGFNLLLRCIFFGVDIAKDLFLLEQELEPKLAVAGIKDLTGGHGMCFKQGKGFLQKMKGCTCRYQYYLVVLLHQLPDKNRAARGMAQAPVEHPKQNSFIINFTGNHAMLYFAPQKAQLYFNYTISTNEKYILMYIRVISG